MSKIRIGSLFLGPEHYRDEANKTIGQPLISKENDFNTMISNRRAASSKLSDAGQKIANKTVAFFKEKYGLEVKLQWDRYAGCTMCPCSPGFKIVAEVANKSRTPMRDEYRFTVYSKGKNLDVREPEYDWIFIRMLEANKKGA